MTKHRGPKERKSRWRAGAAVIVAVLAIIAGTSASAAFGESSGQSGPLAVNQGAAAGTVGGVPQTCYTPSETADAADPKVPDSPDDLEGVIDSGISSTAEWLGSYIWSLIDANNEMTQAVQAALSDLRYCYPDYNIVIARPTAGSTQHMTGVLAVSTTKIQDTTFRIYVFRSGQFYQSGDLGWLNWAYAGWWSKSGDGHTVTFSEPPAPARDPGWQGTPNEQSCEVQGRSLPDPGFYYGTYSETDHTQAAYSLGMLLNDVRGCFPDYNVLVMHDQQPSHWITPPSSYIYKSDFCLDDTDLCSPEQGNPDTATVYVFTTGTFRNDGDGGYNNWAFYGNFTRSSDGTTVTFGPPAKADLSAIAVNESQPADFNSETPMYTSTANGPYPGCNFTGSVPGDAGALTQSLVSAYGSCFPGWNIVVVSTLDNFTFSDMAGFEHIATVNGDYVLGIKSGIVVNNGDGGWQNWGFAGTYDRPQDNEVIFH